MESIVLRVRFVGSPLHSRALMPNREVKNDSGRKITVKTVKTVRARDWFCVSSASQRASRDSSTLACFCLRSRRLST